MDPLEHFLPIDPGPSAWHSQPESQMMAKAKAKPDEEEDDDEDEEEDDDEDDDPDADKTPEEIAAELKEIRLALEKANGSSARRRKLLKDTKAKLDAAEAEAKAGKAPKASEDDDAPDVDTLTKTARAEGRKEALLLVKRSATSAALAGAGVSAERLARAAKLIDLDDLDVADDGTIDGLEDAVDELKVEWPELFAPKRTPRRTVAGKGDGDGEGGKGTKKMTASERQAKSILGG